MTEITDLSPTDSSNTSVSGESLDGAIANMGRMDDTLQAILGMFGRWTSSDTIASAGTTDIGAQPEAYLIVSGTTTITGLGTVRAGTVRFLKFSGILTLTHNATTLILPGSASITTAAGDTAVFVSEGSGNWRCLSYNKASGQSVIAPSVANCRLTLSGGNLSLGRFNGRLLTINGVSETIPGTAPTLAASGLTPSTLYYIYAYMNAGVMTLESSTTAYAIDTTTGVYIKTGDATRTLVGMARPVTGPAWANTSQNRFVRSWYNEPVIHLSGRFTANRQRTSTAWGELNSEIRCEFLAWSGETMLATGAGSAINGAAGDGSRSALGFDSTTVPEPNGAISLMGSTDIVPFSVLSYQQGLTEGYHYVTFLGAIQTGPSTSTWYGDTDGRRVAIIGSVAR